MLAKPCRRVSAIVFILFCSLPALAEAPAPPSAQEAWKTYEKKAFHFSIALPAGWKVVELDPALLESSLGELAAENPALGKVFGPQVRAMVRSGVKFMAVDAGADLGKGGFATNLNVIVNPAPVGRGLAEYLAAGVAEIEALSGIRGEVTEETVDLGGHPAGRVRFRMLVNPADGTEVALTQIYVLAHGRSLVFTLTTVPAQSARYEAVFAGIAERLRILD